MITVENLEASSEFRELSDSLKQIVFLILETNTWIFIPTTAQWKKSKSAVKSSEDLAKSYLTDVWNYTYPETLKGVKFIEENYTSLQEIIKSQGDFTSSVEDNFRKAFYENLVEPSWTKLDENAWKNIKYTFFEDKTLIIAPTGRGREYKVIGQDHREVYKNLVYIGRLKYMSENVIKPLNKMIFGQKFVEISELSGENLPGSIAESLYKPKAVWGDSVILGMTLTSLSKITVQDYVQKSMEMFLAIPENEIKITNVISNDPNEPCFRFIDLNMKKGNCDSWKKWMKDTFEHHEITSKLFMAWLAGVVIADNNSKQLMYIHGFGNDAKSQVINALCEYFEQAAVALNKESMKNQFGFAKLENKRLITISDSKNPELLRTGFIHQITGGDVVDIERKQKDSYSAKMFGKILVCENIAPSINIDEVNQVTRLIYIKCRKRTEEENVALGIAMYDKNGEYVFVGSKEFPLKLIAETEAFIAECLEVYKEYCPTDSAIIVPKSYIEEVIKLNCGDITESFDIDLLNSNFKKGSEEDFISEPDFWNAIARIYEGDFNKKNKSQTSNINKLITTIFNIDKKWKRIDGINTRILSGIKLKNNNQDVDKHMDDIKATPKPKPRLNLDWCSEDTTEQDED